MVCGFWRLKNGRMGQIWDWGSIWLRKKSLPDEWLTLASDALGAAVEGPLYGFRRLRVHDV